MFLSCRKDRHGIAFINPCSGSFLNPSAAEAPLEPSSRELYPIVKQSKGEAQAKAYRDQVAALTAQGVTTVEVIKAISAAGLKITPDIQISGSGSQSGDSSNGLVQVLLAQFIQQQKIGPDKASKPAPSAP